MANAHDITGEYIKFIGTHVIEQFGGSYQNYQTIGKVWRQQFHYSPEIEDFILTKTKLFLNIPSFRTQNNFNLMYKVCNNIGDYLSKYLVKRSPDLSRKQVADEVVSEIFLNNKTFVNKFENRYKKPIDMANVAYVKSNPGVMAMYNAIQNKTMSK